MKKLFILFFFMIMSAYSFAQLTDIKINEYPAVRDQGMSGTCWCFANLSMIESDLIKQGVSNPNLSEMYIVRNVYFEKAKNYVLRQGFTRFSEGAFSHDLFPTIEKYGIVPEEVYPNTLNGGKLNHMGFDVKLKAFLDSVIASAGNNGISNNWQDNYNKLLDQKFGAVPKTFEFQGKQYTPITFANEVVKLKADDFIGLTSFTHHPFYKPFNVEVPDNYSGGLFYNVPIDELIKISEEAIMKGYTVGWDADVSNENFDMKSGYALLPASGSVKTGTVNPDIAEANYTQQTRQDLFESLVTQDDHLMHLVGLKQSPNGKKFFFVKNSWGVIGSEKGFINVSEAYYGVNTITIVVHKDALSPEMKAKLNI